MCLFSDPKLKSLGEAKYNELQKWFNQRLEDAIKAAQEEKTEPTAIFGDGKTESGM